MPQKSQIGAVGSAGVEPDAKQPRRGFLARIGLAVTAILFGARTRSALASQTCPKCGGAGKIKPECSECNGSGGCRRCGGTGQERCSRCNGTGEVDGAKCPACNGNGNLKCVSCNGSTKCFKCNGTGRGPEETCDRCKGTGVISFGAPASTQNFHLEKAVEGRKIDM